MDQRQQKDFDEKYNILLKDIARYNGDSHESYKILSSAMQTVSNIESSRESQKTQKWIKWATIVMALTSIVNLIITLCR